MIDCTGREIKPGDRILYAATDGRSAALRFATVLEIRKSKGKDNAWVQPDTRHLDGLKMKATTLHLEKRIYLIASRIDARTTFVCDGSCNGDPFGDCSHERGVRP